MTKSNSTRGQRRNQVTRSTPAASCHSPKPSPAEGVKLPQEKDVALGRGGMANNHVGNKFYREILDMYKIAYLDTKTHKEKGAVVGQVFDLLEEEGYRFVHKVNGLWYEAPYHKARLKVVQGLREKAPELRKAISSISFLSGDQTEVYGSKAAQFTGDGPSVGSYRTDCSSEGLGDESLSTIASSLGAENCHEEDEEDANSAIEGVIQDWDPLPLACGKPEHTFFAVGGDAATECILSKLLRLDL